MNQSSHPPARALKTWMRALSTAFFALVFALVLTAPAHAQIGSVQVTNTTGSTNANFVSQATEFNPANTTNTPYLFSVLFLTDPVGTPPVRPGLNATSTIHFIIEGDTTQAGRAAYPAGDLMAVANPNLTSTANPDGTITGAITANAGSIGAQLQLIAVQDAETEPDESFRITMTSVDAGGSFRINSLGASDFGIIQDTSAQNSNTDLFTISATSLFVGEQAETTFTLTPNSAPAFPVTVQLTSSDSTTVAVITNTLTFPANSVAPQTVRVVGVSDGLYLPNIRSATIQTANAVSLDDNFNNGVIPDVNVTVFNTDQNNASNSSFTVSPTVVVVNEAATTTVTVKISSAPTFPVYVPLSIADPAVATIVGSNVLVFNANDSSASNLTKTVTIQGISDGASTPAVRSTTLVLGNAISTDTAYNNLDVPDVPINILNAAFAVSKSTVTTTEAGGTDSFTVTALSAPTANVTLTLTVTTNPSTATTTEATLRTAAGVTGSSVTLTFTPANFATPQTVTVIGVDDGVTGAADPAAFTITGVASSVDPNFNGQVTPIIIGTNTSILPTPTPTPTATLAPGVTPTPSPSPSPSPTPTVAPTATPTPGPSFNAGTRTLVSFPYTLKTDTAKVGTATVTQAFGPLTTSLGTRYTLYRFNSEGQTNSFATSTTTLGADYVALGAGETLELGRGYLLVVSNLGSVTMRTPGDDPTLTAIPDTQFAISLKRNPNFTKQTRKSQSFNGYNLIGFPFNPAVYSTVNLSNVQVVATTINKGRAVTKTYESLSKAAGAGVIKGKVFGIDSAGRPVQLSGTNYSLTRYRALYVQSFRDTGQISFILRNPS